MKTKSKRVEIDCENPVIQPDLVQKAGINPELFFLDFVKYAKSMGVDVNTQELYNDYKEEKCTPGVLAFISWKIRENEVGSEE